MLAPQARFLATKHGAMRVPTGEAEPDWLSALTSLKGSWFVGIAGAYHESLCAFRGAASGAQLPRFCDCKASDFVRANHRQPKS